jgi:hypothetical protein
LPYKEQKGRTVGKVLTTLPDTPTFYTKACQIREWLVSAGEKFWQKPILWFLAANINLEKSLE